jgi:hypothetical protein
VPRTSLLAILLCALAADPAPLAPAQATQLRYQNRGTRYEGIRPRPVGGLDVDLISVRADYTDDSVEMPDRLRLRFYLDRPVAVHITVRELDYVHYYWMDRLQPETPWRPGFDNDFDWPTRDVLKQLRGLKMYDLGVVARLEKPEPDRVERVAPVILYQARLPDAITGYLFTFKSGSDAGLMWSVHKEGAGAALARGELKRQPGGRPFTVRWDASQADAGSYSIALNGRVLETGAPIAHMVSFYHQPRLR